MFAGDPSGLGEVRNQISSGQDLSQAFAGFGELFPALYPAILRAGERSGELEQVIRRFVRYQKLVLSTQKRVVSALVYPAVLVALSMAVLLVLSIYVVPSFEQFFADLNAELPVITRLTLEVSLWIRNHLLWLIFAALSALYVIKNWSTTHSGRLTLDAWRLRLPILGQVFHQFSLSQLCRSMSTLIAGGIPIVEAFEIAVGAMSNRVIRHSTRPAIDRVREGRPFHQALDETEVFPFIAIDMIEVGEATASLDEMLSSVADYFDEKIETRIERFLSLVEPTLIVIMGCVLAFILISIYLPVFSTYSQIG